MSEYKKRLEDLSEIRSMMEQSTRFISLSGLSGVSAGIVALIGAWGTSYYLMGQGLYGRIHEGAYHVVGWEQLMELLGIALLILVCALAFAMFFSMRLAKRKGLPLWNRTANRLLINLMIPLVTGGIFCFLLAYYGFAGMVAPATLIFYGMALLNAGKYTLIEVRYLGICEIILGLVASCMLGYGIIFWAIGFGILHIIYGIVMYIKYEK